jgi:hypothetical protein
MVTFFADEKLWFFSWVSSAMGDTTGSKKSPWLERSYGFGGTTGYHRVGKLPNLRSHHKKGYEVLIWLVVWNMAFMTFRILGMSSSQLTNIFQRGRSTTNHIFFVGLWHIISSTMTMLGPWKVGSILDITPLWLFMIVQYLKLSITFHYGQYSPLMTTH